MNARRLIFLVLSLVSLHSINAAAQEKLDHGPIKPSVFISLSRQVIQENDFVHVDLWIANDSDDQFLNIDMHIAAPDFLEWHEDSCDGRAFQEMVHIGSLDAHTVLRRRFCAVTRSVIKVGEFNIPFTFKYQWRTAKGIATSVVSYEKTIRINILGSDNVAGIPLAFAGFVVPGLFFWFVIHLFRAPWNVGVALGDKLIYSVLVSLCIVGAGKWISLISINNGISIDKLIRLAFIGGLLGIIVGSVDFTLRLFRQRRLAENEIVMGEDEATLLRKLLQKHSRVKAGENIVRLKNGEEYIGSLVSRNASTTSLVGWFKIDLESQPLEVAEQMNLLQRRGRLVSLFDLARRHGIEVQIDDAIQQKQDDEWQNTGEGFRQWSSDEVAGITAEANNNSKLPLRLA